MKRAVLTIAGSDPSGGAGIQADLRVFQALGVHGLSAITALTVQNSLGVEAVHPVPGDVLYDQVETLLEDTPVAAVKIGMLGGAEQVHAVSELLRRFRPPNVVLDPVLTSAGGVPLLDEEGRRALLRELVPLADLVTPNLCELQELAGTLTESSAERLFDVGTRALLIKGGHLPGEPKDTLAWPDGRWKQYPGVRIQTPHTHGTGCLLSSAIAAYLALGEPLEYAVEAAKALLTDSLRWPVVLGRGRGYPDSMEGAAALEVREEIRQGHGYRLATLVEGLYVLTDSGQMPGRSHEEIARAAFAGGAKAVQLRDKRLSTPELIALARRVTALAREQHRLLLVNDRVDVALASEADGVHLGPDDMHPADARRLLGPERIIGVSVSTVEEANPIAAYASYLGVGAIFGSATKDDAGPPVGTARIAEIRRAFPQHPIVAIGGIHIGNIDEVAAAGAATAAVVSAVVCAPDMETATRELWRRFLEGRNGPGDQSPDRLNA